MNSYKLGIDIGSTTVKIALIDDNKTVIFSDYERHFANIQETLQSLLEKAVRSEERRVGKDCRSWWSPSH